jgi:crossover junction endodeoxyribonuclease RuvC
MSEVVCGIDPGAHGAVAFVDRNGALLSVHDMPTCEVRVGAKTKTRIAPAALSEIIGRGPSAPAFVERVSAMPGQGVSSCFAFGYAAGLVEGILATLGFPVTFVTPQSWKKSLGVTADKGSSRQRAMQLFPSHAGLFARVKDDGRAEAALIALYGLRSMS